MAEESVAVLPPGDTPLGDVACCQVGWQSYGNDPVVMPRGWQGDDPASGIACVEHLQQGRQALFMHSPWRVPPGKTWINYPVALPQSGKVQLRFGIAMSTAAVGKSDGVTFSCHLIDGDHEQELMREHYAKDQWKDYSIDLASHAGKKVVVRLQVEPGPKNDTSFDFAYFGDAKITIDGASQDRAGLVQRLTSTRAYLATEKASLIALANRSDEGVTPANLLPHKNTCQADGDSYRFVYEADDCRLLYTYNPASGTLDDWSVQVDDGPVFLPAAGGGVTARMTPEKNGKPDAGKDVALRGGRLVNAAIEKDAICVLWEYEAEGQPVRVAWQFGIAGKALLVSARCDEPVVSRFSLGEVGGVALRRSLFVPYLPGRVAYLPGENVYVCRYLDWTQSGSSACPQGDATYEVKTDGTRNPLVETGYIAVSPHLGEVLPNTPSPQSPYMNALGPCIMLDVWQHHKNTYQGDAELLAALKDHGVDHMVIIQHVWQRYGYDVKLPDHLPANPQFGGDEGMIAFGKAANAAGYLWSLHENYIDTYPDAPSYDSKTCVLSADGSPSKAWFNEGTKVQSYGLKCNRALDYAKQTAPEAHRRYGTTAAYLDVHACVQPWHQLDHEAGQPMAAMEQAKVKYDTELFQFMREAHQGPMFGEGANHFYWAGRCDGVEAQVNGGASHVPLLDFDLLKIHPQMVNHGMGYYERWFAKGYQQQWGRDSGTIEQIDQYRAQELAYGHAGFIGSAQTANIPWVVREHHLLHPVQRLYGTARPLEISYEVEEQMVNGSVAMAVGQTSRQRIRYDSGLTVWVNWRTEPWKVEGRTLPQWGFLALGPDTEVSTTLRGDRFVDYAECPEYVFADARTCFPMPYRKLIKDIEPRLRDFKHLGDNRVQVTYEWIVHDTLDKDYICFVHGMLASDPPSNDILFQQDHATPKPTSQWRKGETIVDGPYEFRLPAKEGVFELNIGLYKDQRILLTGLERNPTRIAIATLNVQCRDGKVTSVAAQKIPFDPGSKPKEAFDFNARINPPDTWADFGNVATDGAVKINREADRLVLFPYPRDTAFRVSLDLKQLAPKADPSAIKVHALAAGSGEDLGLAEPRMEDGRLTLTVGKTGAGRYVVKWK